MPWRAFPGIGAPGADRIDLFSSARARQEITSLRAENATLREQAARHLGQQRAQEHGTQTGGSPRL